ncbi:MAG: hypothetical protein OXI50_16290 [Gammaproteobacteria bacterium]|nr:hypothetical protein [Gammaproteobacteria bacterium]
MTARARARALVEYVGGHLELIPWERRFLSRLARTEGDLALSVARGNGKSALCAAIGAAVIDGPLRIPDAEVVLVASSFAQAGIMFRDVKRFLGDALADRGAWRTRDTTGIAELEHFPTRARLKAIGSDPRRMHGLRPLLVLADEPAQWGRTTSEAALAALRTGLGKHPRSRLIALGTRPADGEHWFARMLREPGATVYAARPDDPIGWRRTWRRANPSLDAMPHLEARIRLEAEEAKWDPVALASFRALRLNLGVADVVEDVLIEAATWRIHMGNAAAVGPYVLGLDLGQTEAMSAAAGYWPDTGRLDAIACFGDDPDLRTRGLRDGVGRLYIECAKRGELVTSPGRVSDLKTLLGEVWERWGKPIAIVCDRWREGELRDALAALRWPRAALVVRGMGYRDGGEDVRNCRKAVLGGHVTPLDNLLLTAAMSEARTISDAAGNSKLAKGSQSGRRRAARDDAAAAAILAVALAWRRRKEVQPVGLRTAVVR